MRTFFIVPARFTVALCLLLGAALPAAAQQAPAAPAANTFNASSTLADPLQNYYGNTLVCAAALTLNDLCHLWLYRDGSFINFDANGAHTGHYSVGPMRPDGKVPVCQFWDTVNMLMPVEIAAKQKMPGPPPGAAGGVMICENKDFRTTCRRGVDPATLSEEQQRAANRTMGERFHNGMCYPLGPHNVGDIWWETDDPLPGQAGADKLLLLPGHR